MNQLILVGRLTNDIETKEVENGKKVCYITIAVLRATKNEEGAYETDFIPCTLWNTLATNTAEYCHKGDVVGVKGRLESDANGIHVVAEKISFLSDKKDSQESVEE